MTTKTVANPYTKDDCGCYVDGARGIYATDAIVQFARSHGATISHTDCCDSLDPTCCFESEFAECPNVGEFEDAADSYMNEVYPVEGAYWGRSDAGDGDWGLWLVEEDEEEGEEEEEYARNLYE